MISMRNRSVFLGAAVVSKLARDRPSINVASYSLVIEDVSLHDRNYVINSPPVRSGERDAQHRSYATRNLRTCVVLVNTAQMLIPRYQPDSLKQLTGTTVTKMI